MYNKEPFTTATTDLIKPEVYVLMKKTNIRICRSGHRWEEPEYTFVRLENSEQRGATQQPEQRHLQKEGNMREVEASSRAKTYSR